MHTVIVYESMYGNTHAIATAIAAGLADSGEVSVVAVGDADAALVAAADLVVVGGPTHAHAMTRDTTRHAAVEAAHKPDSILELDPDAEGAGLRDWFDALEAEGGRATAFDTRVGIPAALSGRASKGITRRLERHGFDIAAKPESFLVTKENVLVSGEAARATEWGAQLGRVVAESMADAASRTA